MRKGSYKTPKVEGKDQVLLITLSTYSNLHEVSKGLVKNHTCACAHTHAHTGTRAYTYTHNQERKMNHH